MIKYILFGIFAALSIKQPIDAHSVDMDAFLKSAYNEVVIPATIGVACGLAGRRLPNANGVDQVATLVGTDGTVLISFLGTTINQHFHLQAF